MDDFPELRAALGLAATVFAAALSGALNPFLWIFLLGVLIGIVLLGAWLLLEIWANARAGTTASRPARRPAAIRVREWGEAFDIWSKVALCVADVILIVGGGAGALGAGINRLRDRGRAAAGLSRRAG